MLLNGFAIDVTAVAATPGMSGGGHISCFDLMIQGLGVDDLSLADRFVEDGVRQGAAFVENGNFSLGIFADRHLDIA